MRISISRERIADALRPACPDMPGGELNPSPVVDASRPILFHRLQQRSQTWFNKWRPGFVDRTSQDARRRIRRSAGKDSQHLQKCLTIDLVHLKLMDQ